MKTSLFLIILLMVGMFAGCSVQPYHVDQRVIELPAGNPKTSLDTAVQIANTLVAEGFGGDVKKRFPNLSQKQLEGLFLTPKAGSFQGKTGVFLLTGIRSTSAFPEAKAVAEYCESRVRQAVFERLIHVTKIAKMAFADGDSALVMEYETATAIDNMTVLRGEVDWIWEAFKTQVEDSQLKTGVIRAVHPEGTGLITHSKGYGFVFVKRDDGKWHCLQDEKK